MHKSIAMPIVLAAALGACGDDANPMSGKPLDDAGAVCFRQLDVLFVVDQSVRKKAVHDKLYVALPRFLKALASGDLNQDGTAELTSFTDVHVGVITSDLGIYREDNALCTAHGEDGMLLESSPSGECTGNSYPYQVFVAAGDEQNSPEKLIEQTQCRASVGLERCPYEQPLEAMYKALAPSTVSFFGGTTGHGTANAGFLRENAVLAVVHVTDDDDCSVRDDGTAMFEPKPTDARLKSPASDEPLGANVRCALAAEGPGGESLLAPVSRYVDGLKALKPGHPERIVFGVIGGIPLDLNSSSPEGALARSELVPKGDVPAEEVDSDVLAFDQTQLTAACSDQGSDLQAAPSPRLAQVAKGFGENGLVGSVCAPNYDGLLDALAVRISAELDTCQCDPNLDVDAGGCDN